MDSHKNKWIPQWKRDEQAKLLKAQQMEEQSKKGVEKTEDNFPALAPAPTIKRVWGGDKKFSDLAKEWSQDNQEKADKEKYMAEFEKSKMTSYNNFVLPTFNCVNKYVEEDEPEESEDELPVPEDSVWTVVNYTKNKRNKEKDMEEIANRPPTPDEDSSVWQDKKLNETYWDERT